jgi:hypothetical protein
METATKHARFPKSVIYIIAKREVTTKGKRRCDSGSYVLFEIGNMGSRRLNSILITNHSPLIDCEAGDMFDIST